jgi:hypothetical protein
MASRLPISLRPAANEVAISYLTRLATVHAMPIGELWEQVSGQRRGYGKGRSLKADQFAAVVNEPRERLARTIVEFRVPRPDWLALRHEPQRGCWQCNARHPGGPVIQLLSHHQYLCTRHQIWIGPPDQPDHPQPSLTDLPEITAAQHRHRKLIRRLGPAATYDAVLTGFLMCAQRWNVDYTPTTSDARHQWDRRAAVLIPPGTEIETFSGSRLFAATYPEAVQLAELVGSLRWRRLAAGDPDQQRQFTTEISRRLGLPDYRPTITNDAIAHWIDKHSSKPPTVPKNNYRTERTFGGRTYRKPVPHAENARRQLATWFSEHRNGSATMLYHRHLAVLAPRDMTTTNAKAELHQASHPTGGNLTTHDIPEYVRPRPAPSPYLDTATEPVPWPTRHPGPSRAGRPWFDGG